MALVRFAQSVDPMSALLSLQRDLERVLQNPLQGFDLGLSGRGVFPPVNVFGDADGYVVRIEIPGASLDQIAIEARGQTLTISGTRQIAVPAGGAFHRRERDSGEFSRSVQLPRDLDASRAQATYKHGILTVRVPRREEAKPRQIAITTS